jgi:periplasmic divalent cation tolerance protein
MKPRLGQRVAVLMTCGNKREAEAIAERLVRTRRAACVSIYPRGDSLYWWRGAMERSREYLLVAKTRASALVGLVSEVKAIHGYEVPEIIALPIVGGSRDYLQWLDAEVRRR